MSHVLLGVSNGLEILEMQVRLLETLGPAAIAAVFSQADPYLHILADCVGVVDIDAVREEFPETGKEDEWEITLEGRPVFCEEGNWVVLKLTEVSPISQLAKELSMKISCESAFHFPHIKLFSFREGFDVTGVVPEIEAFETQIGPLSVKLSEVFVREFVKFVPASE